MEHSVSDLMFGYFAQKTGLQNYIHQKLRVPAEKKYNLKIALQAMKIFGIRGANITLPYKSQVIEFLDVLDERAKVIGAVNTVVNKKGFLFGLNTDEYGAIRAIESKLRKVKNTDKVVIFGAGGAARAIIFGLLRKTPHIVVVNRTINSSRTNRLNSDIKRQGFRIKIIPLTKRNILESVQWANFVINATPVGMYPAVNNSLISVDLFKKINKRSSLKDKFFFDVVFNPVFTKFLSFPNKIYKAKVCSGLYMMIYQGIQAFEIWTGKQIPERMVREVFFLLEKEIENRFLKRSRERGSK